MITAKTNDGFEIELSEDVLDDAELLDALGELMNSFTAGKNSASSPN